MGVGKGGAPVTWRPPTAKIAGTGSSVNRESPAVAASSLIRLQFPRSYLEFW